MAGETIPPVVRPAQSVTPESVPPPPGSANERSRPEGLRGMCLDEILTLEIDGGLNNDEKKWLHSRDYLRY